MFTPDDRDRTLRALISRAEQDPDVTGAVLIGSAATGDTDRWSDLDLAFVVHPAASAADVAEGWTAALGSEFGVVHHWDLPVRSGAVVRVFLLADGQELDLSFYPDGALVRLGPAWRPLFGDFDGDDGADESSAWQAPGKKDAGREAIGLTWHHLLHADTCVQRGRGWQAEHWIGQARTHIIELACLRLGFPTAYAKGAHLLPADVTDTLAPTLVRSLELAELRRALAATTDAFVVELRHHDSELAGRLAPVLTEDRAEDRRG